jgi:hypothetical protein
LLIGSKKRSFNGIMSHDAPPSDRTWNHGVTSGHTAHGQGSRHEMRIGDCKSAGPRMPPCHARQSLDH